MRIQCMSAATLHRNAWLILLCSIPHLQVDAQDQTPRATDPAGVQRAVEKGLFFIEQRSMLWWKNRQCSTCHEGQMLVVSTNVAKTRGVKVDQEKLDFWTDRWLFTDVLALNEKTQKINGIGTPNAPFFLLYRDKERDASEERAGKWATLLKAVFEGQQDDGNWDKNTKDVAQVTPGMALALADLESSKIPFTPSLRDEISERRERTDKWIRSHKVQLPEKTESLAGWVVYEHQRGDKTRAQKLLDELLNRRREDRGWGIKKADPSHQLVTAVVLLALKMSGLPNEHPVVASTQIYLLDKQQDDGRWRELGRHFHPDSNHSAYDVWTTGYAVAALSLTLPQLEPKTERQFIPDPKLAADVAELTRNAAEGFKGRTDRTGAPMQPDERPVPKEKP